MSKNVIIVYNLGGKMTKQTKFESPINSISSFYVLAHMLCECYLYPLNTPIQVHIGNKTHSFCLAFNKDADTVYLASIDAPASVIENMAERIHELFISTLTDLEIHIVFVNIGSIAEKTQKTLSKTLAKHNSSALFFTDPNRAYDYLTRHIAPHNFPDDETIESCWDYMDVAIKYLNAQ